MSFCRPNYAALTLLDFPDDDARSHTLQQTPNVPETGDSAATLIHLAMVFRAIAAVLMHACLTSGTPRSTKPRHALALSLKLASRPTRSRIPNWIGFVHDTS